MAYADDGAASSSSQSSSSSTSGGAQDSGDKPTSGPASPSSTDDDDDDTSIGTPDASDDDDDDADDEDTTLGDDDDAGEDAELDDDDDQDGGDTALGQSDETETRGSKPATTKKQAVTAVTTQSLSAATVVDETPESSGIENPAPAEPDVTPTQTAMAAKTTATTTASNLTAADEPAPEPIPKAIAVPVLKFVGGFLNLFGVNTNSPLPPLDLGLAAAWTWFRQLQTEWGVAPPTGAGITTGEPDPETGAVTGVLNANNPSAQALTYKITINPLLGAVTVNSNGTFTYTPSEAARLAAIVAPISDVFTVTVSNGIASNYALYTVPISAATIAIPGAPTSISQSANPTTGLVTGQVGSTGAPGQTFTYTVITSTLGGDLTFNSATGEYTYQPSALSMALASLGLAPPDFFTVVANSSSGTSLPAIITVPITAGNATPGTPTSISQSANPTTGLVTGQVGSTDPAGQGLTYTVITSTLGGDLTFNSATGEYTYQPSALSMALASLGLAPPDFFTVVATNGTFTSAPAIISVPITAVNATPSAPTTVSQSTNPATGLVTGQVASTDPAGQDLTYTVITSTLGGQLTFNSSTGTYTYQPSALSMALASIGGNVSDVFTVVATNGTFTSAPAIITVPITAANAKPGTPVGGAQTTNPGSGLVTGSVSASDPLGEGVTYDVITSTLGGTLNFNEQTGLYTYTPSAAARTLASTGVTTPDVFTVVAVNAAGTSSIATITVPIAPNPAAPSTPVKTNQQITTSNGRVTGKLVATDPNGLTLTYTLTLGGIQGSYTVSPNGDFTFTPTSAARYASWLAGGNLSDVFTVTVSNGYSSSSAIITVPVSPKGPF